MPRRPGPKSPLHRSRGGAAGSGAVVLAVNVAVARANRRKGMYSSQCNGSGYGRVVIKSGGGGLPQHRLVCGMMSCAVAG